jgi:hypothetical protein
VRKNFVQCCSYCTLDSFLGTKEIVEMKMLSKLTTDSAMGLHNEVRTLLLLICGIGIRGEGG